MSTHAPDGVARLLVAARRERGLTQEDLAEATGVSVRTIRELERGRVRTPQRATLRRLADAMDLPADDRGRLTEPPARVGSTPPPAELPPVLGDLAGREDELARLRAHGRAVADAASSGTRLVALHGPAGVGKTSLAVAAATAMREDFPDGQLFADLRGDTAAPPSPGELLGGLLRSIGVLPSALPPDLEGRTALFRTLTERLRLLVLLDDAATEAQVRPLLPAGGRCLVLTTSRRPLLGLTVSDLLAVDLLPHDAGCRLLAGVVGARVRAEPGPSRELVELCDGLPLALRIVANRLASRSGWLVAHLAEQLRDERRRLGALTAGDVGVRAALDVSYAQLDPVAAAVFRRAALVSGPTFDVDLAAVVTGVDEVAAARAVETLVDVGLLLCAGERYRFHDLVRLYAREHVEREPPDAREAAVDRLVGWLLARTTEAGRTLDADGTEQAVRELGRTEVQRRRDAATAWLDTEGPHWLAALREGVRRGRQREVVAATRALHWYSDAATHRHPWAEVFELGVGAADALGDAESQAVLGNFAGWALYLCLERYDDALASLDRALDVARTHGIAREEAWALAYRAAVALRTGAVADAIPAAERAVELFVAIGHELGRESALMILGLLLAGLGRCTEALEVHRTVLGSYRRRRSRGALGTEVGEAFTCLAVAGDLAGLGRLEEAVTAYSTTRAMFRRLADPYGEAVVAHRQGLLLTGTDPTAAVAAQDDAVRLFAGIGAVSWELRAREALDAAQEALAAARAEPAGPGDAR